MSFNELNKAFSAKETYNHYITPPAANGTINLSGIDGGLVLGDTDSNETWKLPLETDVKPGMIVDISNSGTGTLTIQNQAAVTLDTVAGVSGEIKSFKLSATSVWKAFGGMTAAQVAQLTALTTSETGTGRIGVPLNNVSKEDGLQLIKQATTVTGYSQLAGKNIVIHIPANSTAEAFAGSIDVPRDFNIASDAEAVLNVITSKDGALDTLTLDAELYGIGVEDGAVTDDGYGGAAVAIPQALTTLQFAFTQDALGGGLNSVDALAFVLTLGGTNDGDAVYIHNIFWTYRKKLVAT